MNRGKTEIVKHIISIEPDKIGVKSEWNECIIDWVDKCNDESIKDDIMTLINNTDNEEESDILIKYHKYY